MWFSIANIDFLSDICKIILAIFLPPLGVFFERGCGADLLINILLTILGYIPGIIHALYVTGFVSLEHQGCPPIFDRISRLRFPSIGTLS